MGGKKWQISLNPTKWNFIKTSMLNQHIWSLTCCVSEDIHELEMLETTDMKMMSMMSSLSRVFLWKSSCQSYQGVTYPHKETGFFWQSSPLCSSIEDCLEDDVHMNIHMNYVKEGTLCSLFIWVSHPCWRHMNELSFCANCSFHWKPLVHNRCEFSLKYSFKYLNRDCSTAGSEIWTFKRHIFW